MMLVDDEGIVADADAPETTHTSIHHTVVALHLDLCGGRATVKCDTFMKISTHK